MKKQQQQIFAAAVLASFAAVPVGAAISTGGGFDPTDPPGEVFLAVFDTQRNISYTRDLGLSAGSELSMFEASLPPDPLYQMAFMNSDPADLRYSVAGLDDANVIAFVVSVVTTSNSATVGFSANPLLTINAIYAGVGDYVDAVNASIPSTDIEDDLSTVITNPQSDGFYANPATFGESLASVVTFNTGAPIGTELAYHLLRVDTFDNVPIVRTAQNVWRLGLDGTLTYGPPGTLDSDGDGIVDAQDNCTQIANTAQRDSNVDGFGNACDADLNDDCIVNVVDLGLFRLAFFGPGGAADFDGDGVVNFADLGILRTLFLMQPGPSGVASCDAN